MRQEKFCQHDSKFNMNTLHEMKRVHSQWAQVHLFNIYLTLSELLDISSHFVDHVNKGKNINEMLATSI